MEEHTVQPPVEEVAFERMHFVDRLLRHRAGIFSEISQNIGLGPTFGWSLVVALVGFLAFGLAIAAAPEEYAFAHFARVGVKSLILFFAAAAICFPTFYVFSGIAGSTMSLKQGVVVMMVNLALTALLIIGAVSVIVFFALVTEGSVDFMGGLNVFVGLVASVLAFVFMLIGVGQVLRSHGKKNPSGVQAILVVWYVVYIAVLIQLISELRPFFDVGTW